MATAHITILTVMLEILSNTFVPMVSRITRRWLSEIRWPAMTNRAVAMVMIPSPPTNMRARITICPWRVQ